MPPRVVVLYADSTDAGEELRELLTVVQHPPLHPVPEGENARTYVQARWSDAEVDAHLVALSRRLAGHVTWAGSLIGPEE